MKHKINIIIKHKFTPISLALVFLVTSFLASYTTSKIAFAVTASELRNQSSQLQDLIDENKTNADGLSAQVDTLQHKVAELDAEISSTQVGINETEKKIVDLQADLVKTEAELERQRGILKSNLKQLYKTTGATSVELLFSSDGFSSFVNKQEYLDQLKNGIKSSLDNVLVLKKDLESKKAEQVELQKGLLARKVDLEGTKAVRSDLLVKTQGEEAKYRAMVEDLKNQQQEVNRKLAAFATSISYAGDGSYPWANKSEYSYYSYDPWGMGYRQCVSYTAWKVAQSGRYMPTDWTGWLGWDSYYGVDNYKGNAKNWPSNARALGIAVDQNPRVGDVAIFNSGPWGHSMYVEAILGGGIIHVSQYNWGVPESYSEMNISTNRGDLEFIHFP